MTEATSAVPSPVRPQLEFWPIDRLVPSPRNARTHSDAQVAEIAGSIRAFGFTNPILAGEDGDVIAGHGRLAAARLAGSDRGAGHPAAAGSPKRSGAS